MWILTIKQKNKKRYDIQEWDEELQAHKTVTKEFDSTDSIVLKSENADRLLMAASALAEGFPEQNITYELEREVADNGTENV